MAYVASQLTEEVTAHAQSDSPEDVREICADGTYFPNNLLRLRTSKCTCDGVCCVSTSTCCVDVEKYLCGKSTLGAHIYEFRSSTF